MMKQPTITEYIENDKEIVALKEKKINHVNQYNIDDIRKTLSMIRNIKTLDDAEKVLEKFMLFIHAKEQQVEYKLPYKKTTKKDLRILFYKCYTKAWSLYHVLVKELSQTKKAKYYEYERKYVAALRKSQPFVETMDPMNNLELTNTEKRNVQHMYNIVSERREKGIFFQPYSRSIIAFCALTPNPLPTKIICPNMSVLKRFQKELEQLNHLFPMPSKHEFEIEIVVLKTCLKDSNDFKNTKKKRYFLSRSIKLDFNLLDLWDGNTDSEYEIPDIWYFGDTCNRFYPYLGEK